MPALTDVYSEVMDPVDNNVSSSVVNTVNHNVSNSDQSNNIYYNMEPTAKNPQDVCADDTIVVDNVTYATSETTQHINENQNKIARIKATVGHNNGGKLAPGFELSGQPSTAVTETTYSDFGTELFENNLYQPGTY